MLYDPKQTKIKEKSFFAEFYWSFLAQRIHLLQNGSYKLWNQQFKIFSRIRALILSLRPVKAFHHRSRTSERKFFRLGQSGKRSWKKWRFRFCARFYNRALQSIIWTIHLDEKNFMLSARGNLRLPVLGFRRILKIEAADRLLRKHLLWNSSRIQKPVMLTLNSGWSILKDERIKNVQAVLGFAKEMEDMKIFYRYLLFLFFWSF